MLVAAIVFGAILACWNVWPFIVLWRLPLAETRRAGITPAVRRACALSLLRAAPKALFALLVSLTAPLVVPVALLFCRWESEQLPRIFEWWDSDVSINGDDPAYWLLSYAGTTYYANAHPRSFRARFVWLGLRNRASRLSQLLGHRWVDKRAPTTVYGFPGASKWQEGWNINEREGVYQLCFGKRIGRRFAWEMNWGHKVWHKPDGRSVANVVNISFAPGRWGGQP